MRGDLRCMPHEAKREHMSGPATKRDPLRWLTECRQPHSIDVAPDGKCLAYVLERLSAERGKACEAELRVLDLDTRRSSVWVTAPALPALPAWSPRRGLLAWVDSAGQRPTLCFGPAAQVLSGTVALPPGRAEWLAWSADEQRIVVLLAEPGSYDQSGTSKLIRGDSAEERARVLRPGHAWRRLLAVHLKTGAVERVAHEGWSVLEAAWNGHGPLAAIVSEDPSGSGWYRSVLARIDMGDGTLAVLARPRRWYFENLTLAPDGSRAAVLEGWCSDAGLLSGEALVVDMDGGAVQRPWPDLDTLTSIEFIDSTTIGWAAWSADGSRAGTARLGGRVEQQWAGVEHLGEAIEKPGAVWWPDGSGFVGALQSFDAPPEIALVRGTSLQVLTTHNQGLHDDRPRVRTEALEWTGRDGLTVGGHLLMPVASRGTPAPCVVLVHGGPTWAWGRFFTETWPSPLALVQAGFAVLLPNPRGSYGRGAAFAEAVIDDIGGEDLHDILRGIDHAAALGRIDGARLAIAGLSYGGFMAAWAPTQTTRFRAAVALSSVSDWPSCILTSDAHDQSLVFLRGDPFAPGSRHHQRSPAFLRQLAPTPTLVFGGADDRCTPPSQGEELYYKLTREGVTAELVIYPREGHGLIERDHIIDAHARMVAWLCRHVLEESNA
jgi:dipeptidyl aminopeptidase/acylaminoacyl peptidase